MRPLGILSRKLLALALMLGCGFAQAASADDYPQKPVKLVLGFAVGGPTDVIARVIAQELTESLGQPVIVENRPGGTASVATNAVAAGPADGYTLLFSSVQLLINPILAGGQSEYDPLKSFAPISNVASLPMVVIAAADSPFNSLQDVVAAAKAKPGTISYGSSGHGSAPHLASATLGVLTDTQMMNVPFRGNGPAMTEVMAGRISFMFYPVIGVEAQVAAKRLKVLAIGTEKPDPRFPGVPTFRDAGFQPLESTAPWVGMLAPAGTPPAVVDKLASAVRQALAKTKVRDQIASLGGVIIGDTPQEYAAFLKKDYEHWAQIVSAAGVKAE